MKGPMPVQSWPAAVGAARPFDAIGWLGMAFGLVWLLIAPRTHDSCGFARFAGFAGSRALDVNASSFDNAGNVAGQRRAAAMALWLTMPLACSSRTMGNRLAAWRSAAAR
jgi:hypothetical protein